MYRTICCELWTDEKVQALTAHEKLLFLYLITNPHSHMSGIYYLPTAFMQHELNMGRGFDGVWMGLLRSGLVDADEKRSQVWVVNMLPYQAKGNKAEKGVASHISTLHNSPLISRFLAKYPQITQYLSSEFIRCPIDTPSIPYTKVPYPDPDPVPDSSLSSPKSESEEGKESEKGEFEIFWNCYPRKVGKKAAQKAFQNAQNRPRIDDLLAAIHRARGSPQWAKEGGQFIPHPATWLNRGQWDDVPVESRPSVFEEFLARGAEHEPTGVLEGLDALDGTTVGQKLSKRSEFDIF